MMDAPRPPPCATVSMCDPSIPLTTGEWEEWGNLNEAKYYEYMLSYGPMENIVEGPKPAGAVYSHHHVCIVYWYTKHLGPSIYSQHHHVCIVYWYTKHLGPSIYSHHHVLARLKA